MRIPALGALALAASAAVVAVPTAANAVAPVGVDDTVGTETNMPVVVNVLANDTDADNTGDTPKNTGLTVTGNTVPSHGTVNCSDSACTYTPETDWQGDDTFTYTVSDGTEGTATDTATVTVTTVDIFGISVSSSPANLVATNHPDDPDFPNWTVADRNPTHKVTGVVTGDGGVLLKDVQVQLYRRTSLGATPKEAVGNPVTSNANGKVVVEGLQPIRRTYYSWKAVESGKNSTQERSVTVTPFLTTNWTKKVSGGFALGGSFAPTVFAGPVSLNQKVVLETRDTTSDTGWKEVEALTFPQPADDNTASVTFTAIKPTISSKTVYRVVVPADNELGREQATSGQKTVSVYDATVTNVETNLKGDEWVTIKNTGKITVNLKGWRLVGNSNEVTLPKRSLAPRGSVRVHTHKGRNDSNDLYLGRAKTVSLWPRTGSVRLFDTDNVELKKFNF